MVPALNRKSERVKTVFSFHTSSCEFPGCMSYLPTPSKSPPIPMNLAPMTRLTWSKWSERAGGVNQSTTREAPGPKNTQHRCFTCHIRNVGFVPASDEIAVEVDHDHPPVVSLKHGVQSCKEPGREIREKQIRVASLSKVNTAVSTCSVLKVTRKCKLNLSKTRY